MSLFQEAQDADAACQQICIANFVMLTLGVLTSVCFKNELFFERNEVDNPWSKWNLPPEFDVVELTRTKKPPKPLLDVCRCVSQLTCLGSFRFAHAILWHFPLTRLARFVRSAPSPTRGEGKITQTSHAETRSAPRRPARNHGRGRHGTARNAGRICLPLGSSPARVRRARSTRRPRCARGRRRRSPRATPAATEPKRRPVRHFRQRLDRLRPRQQPQRTRRQFSSAR